MEKRKKGTKEFGLKNHPNGSGITRSPGLVSNEMCKCNLNKFLDLRGSCVKNLNESHEKLSVTLWSLKINRVANFGIGIH